MANAFGKICESLQLFALDAATGEERWRFDPFASETGTTGRRGVNRGVVLWREDGEERILYTAGNFIHAVDPATGRSIESFGNAGRVDLLEDLDRDVRGLSLVGTSPGAVYRDVFIVSTRVGKRIPAVAQVTKSGHVWVFDRDSGESLFPWHDKPVPPSLLEDEVAWPTQPVPLKPAPFARQHFTEAEVTDRTPAAHAAVLERQRQLNPHRPFDPPSERGTVIFPGFDDDAYVAFALPPTP